MGAFTVGATEGANNMIDLATRARLQSQVAGESEFQKLLALKRARDAGILPQSPFSSIGTNIGAAGGSPGASGIGAPPPGGDTSGTGAVPSFPGTGASGSWSSPGASGSWGDPSGGGTVTGPNLNPNQYGVTSGKIDPMTGMMTPEIGQTPAGKVAQATMEKQAGAQVAANAPLSSADIATKEATMKRWSGWPQNWGAATENDPKVRAIIQNMPVNKMADTLGGFVDSRMMRPENAVDYLMRAGNGRWTGISRDKVTGKWGGERADGTVEPIN